MKSPSSTIHVSEKGTVTVLSASFDAGECLEVYRNCTKPGAVFFNRKGHLDKTKRVESQEQIQARADAREGVIKKRADDELIEAEAAAAQAAEVAKQAKSRVDGLKPKTRKRAGVA